MEGAHFFCEIRAGARISRGVRIFCYTGLKLAFSTESPNLLRLIQEIEETEEEICPVCKKDTCEDPYICLKAGKFIVVGDDFQIEPRQ